MNIVNEIENLLREEQELLLAGNIAGLEALVERKSRLTTELADAKPDLPKIAYEELRARANQNEALLGAAQRGLQAALAQLRQLAQAQDQTTYSENGQRNPMSRQPSSVTEKF